MGWMALEDGWVLLGFGLLFHRRPTLKNILDRVGLKSRPTQATATAEEKFFRLQGSSWKKKTQRSSSNAAKAVPWGLNKTDRCYDTMTEFIFSAREAFQAISRRTKSKSRLPLFQLRETKG